MLPLKWFKSSQKTFLNIYDRDIITSLFLSGKVLKSPMSLVNIFALSFAELFGDFKLTDYANTGAPSALLQGVTGYALVVIFLIRCP